MTAIALLLIPGIPLLLIIAGIAVCSHFGPEYFTGSEEVDPE